MVPFSSLSLTVRALPSTEITPEAMAWRRLSMVVDDWVRSTLMGSSWRMVVRGALWLAVTRAPGVRSDISMRPPMGALISV
jgi:hypothetical protein